MASSLCWIKAKAHPAMAASSLLVWWSWWGEDSGQQQRVSKIHRATQGGHPHPAKSAVSPNSLHLFKPLEWIHGQKIPISLFSKPATQCEAQQQQQQDKDKVDNNLPFYTAEQVAQRNGKGDSKEIWVTYSNEVYDITDFVKHHKGGSFILTAAGGPIDDYWGYWAYHTHIAETQEILRKHHIGYLMDAPEESLHEKLLAHYNDEPRRDERQKVLTVYPWCTETPPELQTSLYTDNSVLYVRNHAPVPDLTADDHVLSLECCPMNVHNKHEADSASQTEISLQDIHQQFPLLEIASTLQCAGNRAVDLHKIHPTAFELTPFRDLDRGMMGNAVWGGYSLRTLLLSRFPWLARLSTEEASLYHVEFEGVDDYVTSTPLSRILDPTADALLAVSMNGEPLPRDHGFPVRALLPGIAGARNCSEFIPSARHLFH